MMTMMMMMINRQIDKLIVDCMVDNCLTWQRSSALTSRLGVNLMTWREEYLYGCQYEVYRIPLPAGCQGLHFGDVRPTDTRLFDSVYDDRACKSCCIVELYVCRYECCAVRMCDESPSSVKLLVRLGSFVARCVIANTFIGTVLLQIVRTVYSTLGLVMFALELYSPKLRRARVMLNPFDVRVPAVTTYNVHCFVVAQDKDDAEKIPLLFRGKASDCGGHCRLRLSSASHQPQAG